MQPFQTGFEQGVAFVDETTEVSTIYLSPLFDGFLSPTLGMLGAEILIEDGADVLFHAAGGSGDGMFDAVMVGNATSDTPIWGIGVDVDEYAKYESLRGQDPGFDSFIDDVQPIILTSVVKRLDLATSEAVTTYFETGEVGSIFISIENGRLELATSGGHIDTMLPEVEAATQAINDGSVVLEHTAHSGVTFLPDLLSP
jgi:basic membrane protein A